MDGRVAVAVRIVSVEDGRVIFAKEFVKDVPPFSLDAVQALGNAARNLVKDKIEKEIDGQLPLVAHVFRIEAADGKKKRVRLDVGSDSGVKKKDEFFIVLDSETKTSQGRTIRETRSIGLLRVIRVTGRDSCVAELRKGEGAETNAKCIRKSKANEEAL